MVIGDQMHRGWLGEGSRVQVKMCGIRSLFVCWCCIKSGVMEVASRAGGIQDILYKLVVERSRWLTGHIRSTVEC